MARRTAAVATALTAIAVTFATFPVTEQIRQQSKINMAPVAKRALFVMAALVLGVFAGASSASPLAGAGPNQLHAASAVDMGPGPETKVCTVQHA